MWSTRLDERRLCLLSPLQGYTIRRGNVVACSPNVSQMFDAARYRIDIGAFGKDVYPNAKTFDPKRFINGIGDPRWIR